MKTAIVALCSILIVIFLICSLVRSGFRNVEEIKKSSNKVWDDAGFEIIGYEGYIWNPIYGGRVWYIVIRKGKDNIIYHGCIAHWFDEFHIYNLEAIDAMKPKQ